VCGHPFEYRLIAGFKCSEDILRELDWLGLYGHDRVKKELVCRGECAFHPFCIAYSLEVDPKNRSVTTCTLCKRADTWNQQDSVWSGYKLFDVSANQACTISDGCFLQAQKSESSEQMACDHSAGPPRSVGIPSVAIHRVADISIHDSVTSKPEQDMLCRAYMVDELLRYDEGRDIGCYEIQRDRSGEVGNTWCNLYDNTRMTQAGGSYRSGRVTFPLCPKEKRELNATAANATSLPPGEVIRTEDNLVDYGDNATSSVSMLSLSSRSRTRRGWHGGWGVDRRHLQLLKGDTSPNVTVAKTDNASHVLSLSHDGERTKHLP